VAVSSSVGEASRPSRPAGEFQCGRERVPGGIARALLVVLVTLLAGRVAFIMGSRTQLPLYGLFEISLANN